MEKEELLETNVVEDIPKVNIYWTDIFFSVETETKNVAVLKGITGHANPGELLAIMGSSGAGKTTLLNVLSDKVQKSKFVKCSGDVLANNQNINNFGFHNYIGYVTQDDILIDTLTVKECLMFSARLKLNGTYQLINDKVESLLESLKLEGCKNTYIGSRALKGISGGEKKRTNIGIELITEPSVLFLDEPTSGLDSFSANIVISLLVAQARKGRTIITTIHQPSSEIFHMFDKLMLMSDGYTLYYGKAASCSKFFSNLGFQLPEFSNPADYFIEILHINKPHQLSEEESRRIKIFKEAYESEMKTKNENKSQLFTIEELNVKDMKRKKSFLFQLYMNFYRFGLRILRNPVLSILKMVTFTFVTIMINICYFQLGKNGVENLRSRNGMLFFTAICLSNSNLQGSVLTFPLMRAILIKEYYSNMYGVPAYFLAKNLVDLIADIFFSFYFGIIIHWIVGMNDNPENIAWFFLIAILLSMSGGSLGFLCGSLFKRSEVALSFTWIFSLPFLYFSGFYRNNNIPTAFRWIENISPMKYGFQALARNEYEGLHASEKLNSEEISGIKALGITMTVRESVMWLALLIVLMRTITLGVLFMVVKKNKV